MASSRVRFMLIWWFLGNCIQCERVGHHFLINTDILRNIWPTDLSLPYKLAIESIFHGFLLISFQACFWMPSATTSPLLPVPSPFSSTRSINNAIPILSLGNSSIPIANCTHFRRSFLFYRLFANKYKIQVIKDIDEEMDLFPLYIEHQKVLFKDFSWFLVLLSLRVTISLQIDPYTLQDHQGPLEQIQSAFCHYWQYILHFSLYFTRGADWWCFCWYSCSLGQPLASILIFFSFIA